MGSEMCIRDRVFIKGNLVGGADIIAQMHENGELKKLIDSVES